MSSAIPLPGQVSVLTQHNDNARTGLNTNETILTPTNVNLYGFGKILSQPVDGPVYAQPLYVAGLNLAGQGTHNVVFVATMNDSVYAFDADKSMPALWHTSFINPAAGITAVTTADASYPYYDCLTFVSQIGIVGTPVIDAAHGTLYVVARTKEPQPPPNNSTYVQVQRLHALDITTGSERPGSPVVITATVAGTGYDNSGGFVSFNPVREIQRPGLLLAGGIVYIGFCSYCDFDAYHGWILGYDAQTLQQSAVFNVSPNGRAGGIWMAGGGLASAPDGSIYCITGNGTFDSTSASPQDFGDSVLKLTQGSSLVVTDYFTPYNQSSMDSSDIDLGSGGAVVLPDSMGSAAHPHLLFAAGKDGNIYLLDRDNLGHFNPNNNNQIVQEMPFYALQSYPPHLFGLSTIFKNRIYLQGVGEYLKAYSISNAQINPTPLSQSAQTLGYRGATPCVSANGTNNGLIWQVTTGTANSAGLCAYDAENLARKLYDSSVTFAAGLPDQVSYVKFVVPTVANGKVYLGTVNNLAVFGLRAIIWSATRSKPSNSIHLVYSAPLGMTNVVQVSSNLVSWTTLGPGLPAGTGTNTFDDPIAAGPAARFYRITGQP